MSETNAGNPGSGRIDPELVGKFARIATRRRQAEERAAAEKKRADDAAAELLKLRGEFDMLKSKSDPKRVDELLGEIRKRDYRAAFDKAAVEAGVQPKHLDRLYRLSEIDTTAPEVDLGAIAGVVAGHKADMPEWFTAAADAPASPSQADPATPPAPKPAPASGRGGPVGPGGPVIDETAAANDPVYIMKNYDRISEAYKAKHQG